MATGTVKFFDLAKGFGFIVPEGGGRDIFVHKTAVERAGIASLTKGLDISYDIEIDNKGSVRAIQLSLRPRAALPSLVNEKSSMPRKRQTVAGGRSGQSHSRSSSPAVLRHGTTKGTSRLLEIDKIQWQRSYDYYCELAQNASDDFVTRENYWQHAEHFLRMLNGSAA